MASCTIEVKTKFTIWYYLLRFFCFIKSKWLVDRIYFKRIATMRIGKATTNFFVYEFFQDEDWR
jgi:hypothetical protein